MKPVALTLDLTKKKGSYKSAGLKITISYEPYLTVYDMFIYKLERPVLLEILTVISEKSSGRTYAGYEMRDDPVLAFESYYSRLVPEVPLVVGIISERTKRYLREYELTYNKREMLDLQELSIYPERLLSRILHLVGRTFITKKFKASNFQSYEGINVEEYEVGTSFRKFIHYTKESFGFAYIELDDVCDLDGHVSGMYNSENLKQIVFYFHFTDEDGKIPLLIEVILKNGFVQYYKLMESTPEFRLKRMLRTNRMSEEEIVNTLQGTYTLLRSHIDRGLYKEKAERSLETKWEEPKVEPGIRGTTLLVIFVLVFTLGFLCHFFYLCFRFVKLKLT